MEEDSLIEINSCIICMEINMNYIIFDCNHTICLICYEKMLNTYDILKCPICRNIIDDNNIIQVFTQEPTQEPHLCYRILSSTWFSLVIFFILLGGLTLLFIK